jgi:CheY-like chemotaxis protein/anti-sigma regulatory factor (Ser/Thr protein kinase)
MGMLAAGVAHEINNPLTYILYNLESLSEDVPRYSQQLAQARRALVGHLGEPALRDLIGSAFEVLDPATFSDVEERFKDALSGTNRIKEIAKGLGTFSRVEREAVAAVDIRYPIESALSIATNEIKYRASLVKDLGITSQVMASDGRLSQVFLNLLVNAAHAIPEGNVEQNEIRVRTWQEGDEVCAEVRDTGGGIPAEDLSHIFEPFFTTKAGGVGSGLGLSIARSIVTGYGGKIEVTSEVGKGASFVIRLPAARLEEKTRRPAKPKEPRAAGPRGRILVIDDEPGVRAVLRRTLSRHELVEADSGKRGQQILAEDQEFDLILCDMMMPRVSGMEVHRWLLDKYPQLARKVVFMTGGAFTPNAGKYLEQAGNLRIQKPFDETSLERLVEDRVRDSRTKV